MIVEIYHNAKHARTHVATADTPSDNVDAALEFAYRWTQNIHDSWSRGDHDRNPAVAVVAPLPVYDGITYGFRSTMVGDEFKIGDRNFVVAGLGFTEI